MNHFKKRYNKILNEEETSPKKRGRNGRIVLEGTWSIADKMGEQQNIF